MNTKHFIMSALATFALVSCVDDNYVGDQEALSAANGTGAIGFNLTTPAVTRAEKTGGEAAEELNNAFVVEGTKGTTSVATDVVFDNYNVAYTTNTAHTTTSNTANWEYVGLDVNPLATIYHAGDKQTIKYWDYSADQYDFIAYSLGTGGATATVITPSTATNSTGGAYTLAGTTAQLKTVHIADLVTVLNANFNEPVSIKFRKLSSKVRMGLYETVPGYSVKDVKFYTSDAAIPGGSTSATAALYAGSSILPTEATYTVYFPTVNSATPTSDKNKAHVTYTSATTSQTNQTFGELTSNYTAAQRYETPGNVYLGRTSNTATFAGESSNKFYQDVLPYEAGTPLTLKVDYTLQSIDGTQETIKVVGAKAVVPAQYAQWKSGYAYTYLFKISDNTNGYTSRVENDKLSGLHAVTFDAVVEVQTENNQETVTTVATPSITTYQNVPAVNISKDDEYTAGSVYAMVMDGGTLKTDLNTKSAFYSLSKAATEAEVMEALNMNDQTTASFISPITGRNGLVLTTATMDNTITAIPGADGNDIDLSTAGKASKLTVAAGTTYAYVYTVTAPTVAPTHVEAYDFVQGVVVGTTVVTGYYTRTGEAPYVYTEITEADTKAVADTKYYSKYDYYTNDGVYAVKVIKVKS